MPTPPRVFVDFQEAKRLVTVPDVLSVLGLLDQFDRHGETLSGCCPLPQHQHGPYPNREQWKARPRDGIWLWHCFGDCQRGGDSIELAKLLTGYSNQHIRLWLAEHFGDRLTLRKPKQYDLPPAEANKNETAREVATPQRASSNKSTTTLSPEQPPIKPLRFHLKLDPDVPYLRSRGLTKETIARYGLGLCSKGLLAGYVAIPIFGPDPTEYPLAYLGRWPGDDFNEAEGRPRYKWPPEFPKHRIVFGLRQALETPPSQPIICVEGTFGVFHLMQLGYASAAVFGSSMSDEQAEQLTQTSRPLILMFDGNEVGQTGMRKAAAKLIRHAFVRVIQLPPNRQPDKLSVSELALLIPRP